LNEHRLPCDVSTTARALWISAAGRCEIRREKIARPVGDQALVRALFSGVSRGTEALVFGGKVPSSEHRCMRGPNMAGDFTFPVKYGYASVGLVEEGPDHLRGKSVFCLHPHQDLFTVSSEMLSILPAGLPPRRAVLAANMETALNVVWDAAILPGDRVAVFGAGAVGALVAFIASRIIGTEIVLLDCNPSRSRLAEKLGVVFEGNEPSGEFDVLINATGSADVLAMALKHAGQEARVVEASWYGDTMASIALGGAFHARRLSIVSSQVGSVPAGRLARWSPSRRMEKALDLLLDDRLDTLISGETAFADLADAYPAVLAAPETVCHRVFY
jgi:2-desacetyl-2-hydroxyethyl bacteriochlorophyllide A dehydrogenase